MKKAAKYIILALAACLLTGCGQEEETVILPPVTEQTLQLEEIGLRAENLSPYEGIYIEQGEEDEKVRVENACAMEFTNIGEKTIRDAHLVFTDGEEDYNFYFEMLPYGSTVTVVEYDKQAAPKAELHWANSTVNYLEEGVENTDCIEVIGELGVITVENKTFKDLPRLEIYYRRGDGNGGSVGGPCYKVTLDGLERRDTASPEAICWSKNSVVVNVLLYPEVSAE